MDQNRSTGTRKTTETSLYILEAINELESTTLSELADFTGLHTSTLHTHLQTLEETEYVIKNEGEYMLGMKLFHLGEQARLRDDRYRLAKKTAFNLANEVTEEVNFSIEEYGRSIVLFDETSTPSHQEFQVGRYFYMHSSASGKAMLAEFPDERVREIIDKWGLPQLTDSTITNPDDLFHTLRRIKERGYAVNQQEELEGLTAVAMVVNDPDGSVFGTLDISGPSYRLPDNEEIADQLRPFIEELETTLEEY